MTAETHWFKFQGERCSACGEKAAQVCIEKPTSPHVLYRFHTGVFGACSPGTGAPTWYCWQPLPATVGKPGGARELRVILSAHPCVKLPSLRSLELVRVSNQEHPSSGQSVTARNLLNSTQHGDRSYRANSTYVVDATGIARDGFALLARTSLVIGAHAANRNFERVLS